MMRYMLDTNTVSYALRNEGRVRAEMAARAPSMLCLSSITVAELWYGAEKTKSQKLGRALEALVEVIRVEPFGEREALVFGAMAAELARKGKSLDMADALIAAHSIALNVTLVTHDRAFGQVSGLVCTDWHPSSADR